MAKPPIRQIASSPGRFLRPFQATEPCNGPDSLVTSSQIDKIRPHFSLKLEHEIGRFLERCNPFVSLGPATAAGLAGAKPRRGRHIGSNTERCADFLEGAVLTEGDHVRGIAV